MSKSAPASKRPAVRQPLNSGPREKRRSVPEVDDMPPRVREQLQAAALTSNRAQLQALEQTHAMLRSQRNLLIAVITMIGGLVVAMTTLSIVGAVRIDGAERRIDSGERRIERLEKAVFHPEESK